MTKHKIWEKTVILVLVFALFSGIFSVFGSGTVYAASLDDLLPSRDDIPAEYRTVGYADEILDEVGFMDGRSTIFNRLFDNRVVMNLTFRVYEFSTSENAESYYNKVVNELKSNLAYYEVEVPSAFAVIAENGFDVGTSWSVVDEIVFNFEIFNDFMTVETEDALIEYTSLGLSIVPEFSSSIFLVIFLVSTLSIMIVKKKHFSKSP